MRRTRANRRGASPEEIRAVYERDFARFLAAATAIAGDRETGRDAVQDAFARALDRAESFRGESALEAWLWRIVVNSAREQRRSQPRESAAAARADAVVSPNGYRGGQDDEVRRAVSELPDRQRLAVFLRYYADLDYEAIASALGIAPGTVAATLNAAREHVRRSLEEDA
jgi:RNA polymerase sigma factor (sigma-70 family)